MTAALETTLLGKRYGRGWALRDCSLSLPAGRIAGLVGPNGAGKTTLLHLVVGLLRPDAGGVRVLGEAPDENAALLGRVGFVAQDTPLYADFTADELVAMGGRLNPRWDASVAGVRLGRLGIPRDRKVGKLSGGQRAHRRSRTGVRLPDRPASRTGAGARRRRDLLAEHRVLVGVRHDSDHITGVARVVHEGHTDRQSNLFARVDGAIDETTWTVHDVSLEDLVLAYLADTSAAALPGPRPVEREDTRR